MNDWPHNGEISQVAVCAILMCIMSHLDYMVERSSLEQTQSLWLVRCCVVHFGSEEWLAKATMLHHTATTAAV